MTTPRTPPGNRVTLADECRPLVYNRGRDASAYGNPSLRVCDESQVVLAAV